MPAGQKETKERIPSPLALPLLVTFYDTQGTVVGLIGLASQSMPASMIAPASKYALIAGIASLHWSTQASPPQQGVFPDEGIEIYQ